MGWFFVFFFPVMGALLSAISFFVIDNIRGGVELEKAEYNVKLSKASLWLFILAFFTYVVSLGSIVQFHLIQETEIESLEKRIEALETPPQVDTINLVDIIKENGNF